MALEVTFTDIEVKQVMMGQFRVSINMNLIDGATVHMIHPFGVDYKPGDNVSDRLDKVTADLQEVLDTFGAEYQLQNNPAITTKLNTIKAGLTLPAL